MTTAVIEKTAPTVEELIGAINEPEKTEVLMAKYGLSQEELIGMAEKQLAEPNDDCQMV